MNKKQDKFNFFVPLTFEKGTEENGKMLFKGIASSAVEDTDGETLIPAGFDFLPLIEKGYINWNHQGNKTSGAIIGRPTKAEVVNNGRDFYIEGSLYKGVDEAKRVYQLGKALEEDGDPKRQLGFSIEGKALERDFINPKKILKAEITGVAITHCPKNPNTLMSIIKGEYHEPIQESLDLRQFAQEYKDWKGDDKTAWGDIESVKEFLQNYHEDCLDCLEDLVTEVNKAITAEEGEGVTQTEDVDGAPDPRKMLTKADIYQRLIQKYEVDSIEKAKQIYSFIEKVNQKLYNMPEINEEVLNKSFEILDSQLLEKSQESEKTEEVEKEEVENLQKSEETENKEEQMEKSEDNEEMEKACMIAKENLTKGLSREANIEDTIRKGISLSVSQTAVDKAISEAEALKENGGGISTEEVVSKVIKSVEDLTEVVNSLVKSQSESKVSDDLVKSEAFTSSIDSISELIKSQSASQLDHFNQKFSSVGSILQQMTEQNALMKSQIDELTIENTNLRESVTKIEKSSSGPKSITSSRQIERFEKSNNQDLDTYSLSNKADMKSLTDKLFNIATEARRKGREDNELEKAISDIEITKSVSSSFASRLESMGINLVK